MADFRFGGRKSKSTYQPPGNASFVLPPGSPSRAGLRARNITPKPVSFSHLRKHSGWTHPQACCDGETMAKPWRNDGPSGGDFQIPLFGHLDTFRVAFSGVRSSNITSFHPIKHLFQSVSSFCILCLRRPLVKFVFAFVFFALLLMFALACGCAPTNAG